MKNSIKGRILIITIFSLFSLGFNAYAKKPNKNPGLKKSQSVLSDIPGKNKPNFKRGKKIKDYEVWASDQSNSVAGQSSGGTKGSYLWIWNSRDIQKQLNGGPDAEPLGCSKNNNGEAKSNQGPCDLLEVFPQNLEEIDATGNPTGNTLADLDGFGRLHGMFYLIHRTVMLQQIYLHQTVDMLE